MSSEGGHTFGSSRVVVRTGGGSAVQSRREELSTQTVGGVYKEEVDKEQVQEEEENCVDCKSSVL